MLETSFIQHLSIIYLTFTYPQIIRCFSVCARNHLGHLYDTNAYSKPYFLAKEGRNFYISRALRRVRQKAQRKRSFALAFSSHQDNTDPVCFCLRSTLYLKLWRHGWFKQPKLDFFVRILANTQHHNTHQPLVEMSRRKRKYVDRIIIFCDTLQY